MSQSHGKPLTYDPNNLLDSVLKKMDLRNDAAMSRLLNVAAPIISKVRRRHIPIGGALLIRMHEATGLSIAELRKLMGDRRKTHRVSNLPRHSRIDEASNN